MMKLMNKKLTKKGFTLAELLIVVAILAILVAVSIPIFTSRLENAKKSTDLANERAAKAAAVVAYMNDGLDVGATYNYDAKDGQIYLSATVTGATTTVKEASKIDVYGQQSANNNKIVQVAITAEGASTTATWVEGKTVS